jgi:circadian clock protein KaiB
MTDNPAIDAGSLSLRLYVAGNAPNSVRARANLSALCAALAEPYTLEVVDVLDTPLRAFTDGIVLTPTLVKLSPPPSLRMVGDLSDSVQVRAALGMAENHNAS